MNIARGRRAVVFDLDGTLIDSLPLVLAAITHAIEPFGGRATHEIFASLGGPPERFLSNLVGDARHVPAALARLESYHRENAHLMRPYEGAVATLEQLHATGISLALWTGRDRVSTDELLRENRMDGFFSAVVCGDDLASHKPDPEGLQAVLQRVGVAPAEALFVGDADVDVLGGAAAGVDTLLIRSGDVVEAVRARCWDVVVSPQEAFARVLGLLPAWRVPSPAKKNRRGSSSLVTRGPCPPGGRSREQARSGG